MAAYTTPQHILSSWVGEGKPENQEQVLTQWIARAERMLRRDFPTLDERIKSNKEPDLLETVRDIVSAMVTRVFRNPDGVRQSSRTDGSFTGSVTFAGNSPGGLEIQQHERDALKPPGQAKSGKLHTVGIGWANGGAVNHAEVCSLNFGALYCSCGSDLTGSYPLWGDV